MGVVERLDALQRRRRRLGFPLAVVYKFVDDQGGYLAALITYYGFLSLFPLLLLLSTVLGYVLATDPAAQQQVLGSALAQFPVIGSQLKDPGRIGGGAVGLAVGVLGALYGGLGAGNAVQNAMNTAWGVPRNSRPNPIAGRVRGLKLLGTAGLALIGTTVLSSLAAGAAQLAGPDLGQLTKVLLVAASVALNSGAFLLVFRTATARPLSVSDVAPGAVAAAVVWQLLQWFGAGYVGHVVKHASATNGVFALVLGLFAFLYLASVGLVLCAEVNVVRETHLYPRSLLTPFTDNVVLTPADEEAYRRQAQAQRSKGFEDVVVSFGGARAGADPAADPVRTVVGPDPTPHEVGPEPAPPSARD